MFHVCGRSVALAEGLTGREGLLGEGTEIRVLTAEQVAKGGPQRVFLEFVGAAQGVKKRFVAVLIPDRGIDGLRDPQDELVVAIGAAIGALTTRHFVWSGGSLPIG